MTGHKASFTPMIMATSIYNQRLISKRKEQGLCRNCGKPLDREGTYCIECRKRITDDNTYTRHFLQNIGICPRCQKTKLFGDEKVCPECSAYGYSIAMKSREKLGKEHYNEIHREWSKNEHHKRIELGICTRCGKREPDNGFKTCGICRARDRNRKEKKPDRKERYKLGLCYFCDNPIKDGYKVCEEHYQINVQNSKSAKAKESRRNLVANGILY